MKEHIKIAKKEYGDKLQAVSISADFHSEIVRTFKDDLVGATINGVPIRIYDDQYKKIDDIFISDI